MVSGGAFLRSAWSGAVNSVAGAQHQIPSHALFLPDPSCNSALAKTSATFLLQLLPPSFCLLNSKLFTSFYNSSAFHLLGGTHRLGLIKKTSTLSAIRGRCDLMRLQTGCRPGCSLGEYQKGNKSRNSA